MEDVRTFIFEVTVIHEGQVRRYGDSIYRYQIASNYSEHIIKGFCTGVLYPATHEAPNAKYNGSTNFPFGLDSYYKFSRMGINEKGNQIYEYVVCRPYTG